MNLQSTIVSEGTLSIAFTALVILLRLWRRFIRREPFVQWDPEAGTLKVLLDRSRRPKKGSGRAKRR